MAGASECLISFQGLETTCLFSAQFWLSAQIKHREMNALTGHCVSSCRSVMGTSFSWGAKICRGGQVKKKGERERESWR